MVSVQWLGHAAFKISSGQTAVYVDPFLTGNPTATLRPEEVKDAKLILVSHDHFDHLGDANSIAKRTNAAVVAVPEVAAAYFEGLKAVAPNMGSYVDVDGVKVALVPAFHTCSKGFPVGFLINLDDKTIYHAGDTSLFGDMRLIGEVYRPDVALLPIGGYYTMGPLEAAVAVSLIKAKVVIPMHYATFPVLVKDAKPFIDEVARRSPDVRVVVLKPGESYELP
ncbi:MAG: metal-dependent hydrolase [Candidatus Nezhaarchaeales archaeon]